MRYATVMASRVSAGDRGRASVPVYIVRRSSTHGLVGVFAVSDRADLTQHVQNCAEPEECEFCEIDSGGVLWPATGGRKIPEGADASVADIDEVEDQEDPDPRRLLAGAILTESWQEAFYEASYSWQPVPSIAAVDDYGV